MNELKTQVLETEDYYSKKLLIETDLPKYFQVNEVADNFKIAQKAKVQIIIDNKTVKQAEISL